MKTKTLSIILFFITIGISAQNYDWARHDTLLKKGIGQIYGMQLEDAEKTFDLVSAEFAEHPSGKFFKAMITWWRILLDLDDENMDDKFFGQLEKVIDMCDDIMDNNSKNKDALFFKGGALGFRGRLRAIRESWLKAALDGKDGLSLIFKSYGVDPKNPDLQLGFGIYHYYAEVIPQKYPVVKPFMIMFPKGDKNKGLRELENVAMKGRFARIESRYLLMMLNFQFEGNILEARKWAKMLLYEFPNNPEFEKYYALTFIKEGNKLQASKIFQGVYKKCEKGMLGYNKRFKREAAYYIGDYYFLWNQIDSAAFYLEKTAALSREIKSEKESGFLINTLLTLGMLNDQLGKRDKALMFYNDILRMKDFRDSHLKAKSYLKTPYKK